MYNLPPDTMDVARILRLKEGFLLERIDGEISVYHPTLTTAIYLNETGALIWELCDGERSVGDIIDLLGDLYPESRHVIDTDVKKIVVQLVNQGIGELI
jgi:hypothetical protein